MANSSIVVKLKKNVIDAMCQDPDIDSLIDSSKYSGTELENTHIFTYNKNPNTITECLTFITTSVDIRTKGRDGTFVVPTLTIYIYSHCEHIELTSSKNKILDYNRNDYLAYLIDEKFSGSTEYGGIGKLQLVSNTEYVATDKFLARKLIFETVDINDALCDRW